MYTCCAQRARSLLFYLYDFSIRVHGYQYILHFSRPRKRVICVQVLSSCPPVPPLAVRQPSPLHSITARSSHRYGRHQRRRLQAPAWPGPGPGLEADGDVGQLDVPGREPITRIDSKLESGGFCLVGRHPIVDVNPLASSVGLECSRKGFDKDLCPVGTCCAEGYWPRCARVIRR
jgi:hypothetical protein